MSLRHPVTFSCALHSFPPLINYRDLVTLQIWGFVLGISITDMHLQNGPSGNKQKGIDKYDTKPNKLKQSELFISKEAHKFQVSHFITLNNNYCPSWIFIVREPQNVV